MEQIQMGPAGGNGGEPFDHYDVPEGGRLTAIHTYAEQVVNALRFDYADTTGGGGECPRVGGLGGDHHVFYLEEGEYLIGISGRAGWYIDSIQYRTNKRRSLLYGGAGGDRDYTLEAPAGYEIVGLFGRSGWYIDSLGVTIRRRKESEVTVADVAEEEESWLEMTGEEQPLPASVIVRRQAVASEEALDELEDASLAAAIAQIDDGDDEGTVDAAIYTQVVEDKDAGETIAIVMAVAAGSGGVETVGDDPDEAAVMVTDALESEDEIAMLEDEAVEGAIDALLEEIEGDVDEIDVTIYAGMTEADHDGKVYGAVVAIATRVDARTNDNPTAPEPTTRAGAGRSKGLEVIEGIGPKIAALLAEHGITDLATLAEAPVERLREILSAGGRRFRLADPATWPEQATLAASGLWDALTELQSRLKAGRSD